LPVKNQIKAAAIRCQEIIAIDLHLQLKTSRGPLETSASTIHRCKSLANYDVFRTANACESPFPGRLSNTSPGNN
jgi:hypothetical protein